MPLICHVSVAIIICYKIFMIFWTANVSVVHKSQNDFCISLNASHVNNISLFLTYFSKAMFSSSLLFIEKHLHCADLVM